MCVPISTGYICANGLDYYFDTPIDELKFVVTWGGVEVINTVGSCTGTKGSNPNYCGSVGACDGS